MDKKKSGYCVLCIGDLHSPYMHKDAVKFLDCVNEAYKPSDCIQMGDEIDGHAISMHDSKDPDLLSPGQEFEQAIAKLKDLYLIFPRMTILESNHGSLVFRRAKYAGLPIRVLKSYGEVLEAPKGWKWINDLFLKLSNGEIVYFCHGKSSQPGQLSKNMGLSTAEGHFHGKFGVTYWNNGQRNFFSIQTGCLIDSTSLAFHYGRLHLQQPVLGCIVIKEGVPIPIPMILDKKENWIGRI